MKKRSLSRLSFNFWSTFIEENFRGRLIKLTEGNNWTKEIHFCWFDSVEILSYLLLRLYSECICSKIAASERVCSFVQKESRNMEDNNRQKFGIFADSIPSASAIHIIFPTSPILNFKKESSLPWIRKRDRYLYLTLTNIRYWPGAC